tara:strand:- start:149 stop:826 length:678 start_codon:yes stop_codon:yes gene_type:complete
MLDWNLIILLLIVGLLGVGLVLYPFKANLKAIIILVPVCALSLVVGYSKWGSYDKRQTFLANIEKQKRVASALKSVSGTDALISKLKEQVENNPEPAKGWYLLGRLYASQDNWNSANTCFEKAYERAPDDIAIIINIAQSQLQLNHQKFTPEIRHLFQKALTIDKQQPDALAMLAMDAFMNQNYEKAIALWQQLLQLMPTSSEESNAVRKAIARAQEKLKGHAKF